MESIKKQVGNIIVTVDYHTELLGIIMWLSNYHNDYKELYSDYENKFFTDNIISRFEKFKNEEVIKEFEQIVKKHSFNYDAPYTLFLELNDRFKSSKLDNYVFEDRLNSDESIYLFINKLENFAQKIDFETYYNDNIPEYQKYVNNVSKAFEEKNIDIFLKNYYGYDNGKQYYINLLPFTTDGSFFCETPKGFYSCLPVYDSMKKENLFELTEGLTRQFLDATVHEYSHGYVDPLTDKFKIVDKTTDLFAHIKDKIDPSAYPTDVEILNEHIIRAIEIRFIKLVYKDNTWGEKRIEYEEKSGFIYIRNIVQSLTEYEENRDKYPTFDLFYPSLLKELKENIYKRHK